MLGFVTVVSAAIVGLVAAAFLRKIRPPRWLAISGIAALAIGVVLTLVGASELSDDLGRISTWSRTTARIVDSRVTGERAFHVEVVYRYQVDGVAYVDSAVIRQPSFGGKRKRYDVARHLVTDFVPGDDIQVLYNPVHHAQSSIEMHIFWAEYGKTGFGAILVALGVCLAAIRITSRRLLTTPQTNRAALPGRNTTEVSS